MPGGEVPLVRPAEERDCSGIAAILDREIAQGASHFGTEPEGERGVLDAWRRDREVYPWVVAIEAGPSGGNGVLGFARASRWKTRGAYDWACETGVYVGEAARGRGIATALCRALFTELERRGFRCVIAGVAQPNPASDRLHRSMGMTEAGTLPGVGFKHGRWIDVRYYTLRLGDGGPPGPPPGLG